MAVPETRDLRAEILAAAKNLFITQGYHGLSMRQIAEAVGVSKAALYYHFEDKEELFLAILDAYLEDLEALLDQLLDEELTSRERIRSLVHSILNQPAEQGALIRLSSQEMTQLSAPARQAFNHAYHEKFIDKIQRIMSMGMLSGELRTMDPNIATWTLLGMMYPYFYPAHSNEVPPAAGVSEHLLTIYLDGITAPSPI